VGRREDRKVGRADEVEKKKLVCERKLLLGSW
jgi:hypothetical protein